MYPAKTAYLAGKMINIPAYGQTEIEEVLAKTRARNKEIGNYQAHSLRDEDYYSVTLNNGSILLFTAEIQDRHKLLPERLSDIGVRFRPAKV